MQGKARKRKKKRTSQQGFWFFQLTVNQKALYSSGACFSSHPLASPMSVCARISRLWVHKREKGIWSVPWFFFVTHAPESREEERMSLFYLLFAPSAVPESRVFEFWVPFFDAKRWCVNLVNSVRQNKITTLMHTKLPKHIWPDNNNHGQ